MSVNERGDVPFFKDKVKGEKKGGGIFSIPDGVQAIPIGPDMVAKLFGRAAIGASGGAVEYPKKGEAVTPIDDAAHKLLVAMETVGKAVVAAKLAAAMFAVNAVGEPCPSVKARGKACKVAGCCVIRGIGGVSREVDKVIDDAVEVVDGWDELMSRHSLTFYAFRIKTGVEPGPDDIGLTNGSDSAENPKAG